MPTTSPIGVKSFVSSHRSSSQPMPPQTRNPPSKVVITAHPSSAPLEGGRRTSRVFMATGHYQPVTGAAARGPARFYNLSKAAWRPSVRVDVKDLGSPDIAHVGDEPEEQAEADCTGHPTGVHHRTVARNHHQDDPERDDLDEVRAHRGPHHPFRIALPHPGDDQGRHREEQ